MLDVYDKKILYHLDVHARTPASQIARHLKLSKEAVNNRIKQLEQEGIITRYYAQIDASKLGFQTYRISLRFKHSTAKEEEQLITYLRKEPSCMHLRLLQGNYHLTMLATHKNYDSLEQFFERLMKKYAHLIEKKDIHAHIWHNHYNQRHTYNGKQTSLHTSYKQVSNHKLSSAQEELLDIFAHDARKQIVQAAIALDKEPQHIRYHLKRLEQQGIITGYGTHINLKALEKQRVIIDIAITNYTQLSSIITFFANKEQTTFISRLLGVYDLSIELILQDHNKVKILLDEFRERFTNDYETYAISYTYEEYVLSWSPFITKNNTEK